MKLFAGELPESPVHCLLGNTVEPFQDFHKNVVDALKERGFKAEHADSLRDFLVEVQRYEDHFDLFALDLSLLDVLDQENFNIFQRVCQRLEKPVVAIAYLPDEGRELADKLKIEKLICKFYNPQQIWYVLNSVFSGDAAARRRWPRYLIDLPIEVGLGGELSVGESFDLGAGGVFVRTYDPLTRNKKIHLSFGLPESDEHVDCEGRVVFSRSFNPLVETMHPPGMGIEFTGLDEKVRQELFRLLSEIFKTTPDK